MAGHPADTRAGRSPGRFEASDWVTAALVELADAGIAGVRVERLARKLGVTKGSFYWHFKDRSALLDAMLNDWRRKATVVVMERLEQRDNSPIRRLDGLLRFPFASPRAPQGADVELAIRLWGRNDERARMVLEEVDRLRLRFIAATFAELGFPPDAAQARAILTYGFMRVGSSLPPKLTIETVLREVTSTLSVGPEEH